VQCGYRASNLSGLVRDAVNGKPEPVGPPGVMVFAGSTLAIPEWEISIGPDGELTSNMGPLQVAWELWPLWLRVAIDHEGAAAKARGHLLTAGGEHDDPRRAGLVADETRAGMVCICAVAFAVEAMARSAAKHAELPTGIGRNASAA
jgi:hypothetical protein